LRHLARQLADVDRRIGQGQAHAERATSWQAEHAERLRQTLADVQELSHRERALAVQLAHDPPAYVVAALGGRPADLTAQVIWGVAAVRIEHYCREHDLTGAGLAHPLAGAGAAEGVVPGWEREVLGCVIDQRPSSGSAPPGGLVGCTQKCAQKHR